MTKKKIISILLIIFLLFQTLPISPFTSKVYAASGIVGDTIMKIVKSDIQTATGGQKYFYVDIYFTGVELGGYEFALQYDANLTPLNTSLLVMTGGMFVSNAASLTDIMYKQQADIEYMSMAGISDWHVANRTISCAGAGSR